jgi:hypothetical protein
LFDQASHNGLGVNVDTATDFVNNLKKKLLPVVA